MLIWPSQAASISAVRPSLSLTLISAPCLSNNSTIWKREREVNPKTGLLKKKISHASHQTPHLCVSMFGGTKQRDHPPAVGYLQVWLSLQEERTHLHPPSPWSCAQHWQRVGIERERRWGGEENVIDAFGREAAEVRNGEKNEAGYFSNLHDSWFLFYI